MLTMIRVTQNHIDTGRPRCAASCAISAAVSEHVKDNVIVTTGKYVWEGGDRAYISLYADLAFSKHVIEGYAHQFITEFDQGEKPNPFSFQMDIPQEFLREQIPEISVAELELVTV